MNQVLDQVWEPTVRVCKCGQRAWVVNRVEGFLRVWRVVCCDCGNESDPKLEKGGAISQWNREGRQIADIVA